LSVIYAAVKRLIDIGASAALIVLLLPVEVAAAIAVKIGSPGPTFFIQKRGGRWGVPFDLIKFRTMRADHVHDIHEIVPLTHANITPVGRFLRRTKIDELPQLFNVLRGDMSLIGPRPTIMEQVEKYDDFQRRRLEVRPGCTGLAQVNSTPLVPWDERIRYDVYYVDHVGPLMDAWILVKTFLVMFLGEQRFCRPFDESPYAREMKQ
jgi:undecaprenyl phosphate N,N'-diacetylbacillosamine 1-phosphate transferase